MSGEIGSLDDVVRDDRMCSALGERRFDELMYDDELTATMVSWCQDLDFGLDAFDDLPTPDLAKAAARRKAMQRGGRLVGAAAAVAAVCVGGLAVTHLTSSSATNSDAAQPIKSGAVSSPSMQSREQIWRDLSSARDALVRQDWSTARRLLSSASSSLPGVSADDGRDALQTWVSTLNSMLNNHTTIEPTASLGSLDGNDGYVIGDNGVPMLPDMKSAKSSANPNANLPHQLPPLPDLDSPTGRHSNTAQTQTRHGSGAGATQGGSSTTGSAGGSSTGSSVPGAGGSSSAGGSSTAPGHTGGSTSPSNGGTGSDPTGEEQPPLPPAPQIRINAPLLSQLLPQQPSTSPSSLPSSASGTGTGSGATATGTGTGSSPAGSTGAASSSQPSSSQPSSSQPTPESTDQNG